MVFSLTMCRDGFFVKLIQNMEPCLEPSKSLCQVESIQTDSKPIVCMFCTHSLTERGINEFVQVATFNCVHSNPTNLLLLQQCLMSQWRCSTASCVAQTLALVYSCPSEGLCRSRRHLAKKEESEGGRRWCESRHSIGCGSGSKH